MATSVDLNIITGRTGTAHVSSADDAAIWRGLVGSANVVLYTDERLALNHATKGKLTISDGVLCIAGGHMGRISNTKTVDYALPDSGSYRRTLLVARYAISSNIESMTLLTLQNDPVNDAATSSAAAALFISTDSSTDYILYDFVCDADGVVSGTLQTKLTVIDTIPQLRAALDAEQTVRETADTALDNRITPLETYKNTSNVRIGALETWKTSASADISSKMDKFAALHMTSYSNNRSTCNVSGYDFVLIRVRASVRSPSGYNRYMTFIASTYTEETHSMPVYFDSSNDQFVMVEITTSITNGTMTIKSDSYAMKHRAVSSWVKNEASVWVTDETVAYGVKL